MAKVAKHYVTGLAKLRNTRTHFLNDEGGSAFHLPEAYKKFWNEWKFQEKAPVHYIPEEGKWKRNPETGEVTPVQNVALPVMLTPEMDNMLLGGECIIKGFVKPKSTCRRVPRWWLPTTRRSVVHSEILGTYMPTLVTLRLINLIHQHNGFDNYILKTPACDLQTTLALKLKRKILLALATGNCHPDDPKKREEVLKKYGKYAIPLEEAEWYGLSVKEAMIKDHLSKIVPIKPLKLQYRAELLENLKSGDEDAEFGVTSQEKSWISKMNPFSSKEASKE